MSARRILKKIVSHFPKSLFNFSIRLTKNKSFDKSLISNNLDSYSEDKGTTCIKSVPSKISNEYDLQIVVPCYNISKYGERCVTSILNQKTQFKYLAVFIDDGSTDGTLDLLKKYERDNVLILHKENGGSASARNLGLENIRSKYVMFVDSDDYLLNENVLEGMIKILKDIETDDYNLIIEFDYINSSQKPKKIKKQTLNECSSYKLTGFPWGKIYSSKLFEKVCFPEKYWFEDTVMHMIVYPMADLCYKSNFCSYFYRLNEYGMTSLSTKSNKTIDTFYVTRRLLEDREKLKINKDELFYHRFFYQTICNCVRLLGLPREAQLLVFFETQKLLFKHQIRCIKPFKTLYRSLRDSKFDQYVSFCRWFTTLYLNVD